MFDFQDYMGCCLNNMNILLMLTPAAVYEKRKYVFV